jgi:hypothetical protein
MSKQRDPNYIDYSNLRWKDDRYTKHDPIRDDLVKALNQMKSTTQAPKKKSKAKVNQVEIEDNQFDLDELWNNLYDRLCDEGIDPDSTEPYSTIQDEIYNYYENIGDTKVLGALLRVINDLVKEGSADLVLLRNDSAREYWNTYTDLYSRLKHEESEHIRRQSVRKKALAKLSDEEKRLLGLEQYNDQDDD